MTTAFFVLLDVALAPLAIMTLVLRAPNLGNAKYKRSLNRKRMRNTACETDGKW